MTWSRWLLKLKENLLPARRITIIDADTPPQTLPRRNLVLAREDNEDWAVAFRCPCGCGKRLELLLIKEAKPNWAISIGEGARPTLHPSIWLKGGCKSHFWLRDGKVIWV
ncbi:hypothetical protein MIH18_02665 [Marinobacter sp. M3C]|jgi:hypothetical protein|uniref:DUF6527 family protein n=1 Tax=Marinobacter sp. M3C TaxID=2917715 RepID=UPI00200E76A4|nr:DUF6527 family protein [Marinobacter sp. M3C]UQG60874.1 hypothetical protein MIH18_02665 [Marinobacter sp. M3C]